MMHFCTYCDHRYLPRALAMVESLERHFGPFTLWVLALSQECERLLAAIGRPDVRVVPLAALEAFDEGLAVAKRNRSIVEYYFTLSPCWPLFLLKTHPEMSSLTYLDSDLYFFSTPQPIFAELERASIGIIPHRFPGPTAAAKNQYGRFNVGWITWKRDPPGIACLEDWRARCLEWCYDRCEGGKFADQAYLDDWPGRFSSVHAISHPGANVAPWNVARHVLRRCGQGFLSDDQPLVFYHFHGLSRLDSNYCHTHLEADVPSWRQRRRVVQMLYRPYLSAWARWQKTLRAAARLPDQGIDDAAKRVHGHAARNTRHRSVSKRLKLYWSLYSGKVVHHPAA